MATTERGAIKIGTWNVEYAKARRNPDRLKLLNDHDADIWILTETHCSLDLSQTHTAYPSAPRPLVSKVDADSTWVTIWSRFKQLKPIAVPDPLRQVAALFETPIGRLAVAGVVLPWHSDIGDKPKTPTPTNWSEHNRVLAEEMPRLIQNLAAEENCHRVIAGDFNTDFGPQTKKYGYGPGHAGRAEWLRVLEQYHLKCHTQDTAYPLPPRSESIHESPSELPTRYLIDHICSDLGSPKITVWSGEDGARPRLSDHPGVIAEFSF